MSPDPSVAPQQSKTRRVDITLLRRGARCVATLLDELAPRTSQAVWDALPLEGPVYHAKYARNEIYTLVPSLDAGCGYENTTITPIPGDLCYFAFEAWQVAPATHGYDAGDAPGPDIGAADLALFYGRNNLLLNPDFGFVPGNVFARIDQGLTELADAAQDLWRNGAAGEMLRFTRREES